MKFCCLFGHKWRAVPRFKPRHYKDRFNLPNKMCMRCFKQKRQHYALIIKSIEGPGLWYHLGPQWEGQNPPAGFESWDEYWQRMKNARNELVRKAR